MARQGTLNAFEPAQAPELSPPLQHLTESDPVLASIIRAVGPYRLRRMPDAWRALVRAVVFQQISGAAAARVCRRLEAAADVSTPAATLQASSAQFKTAGVPAHKEDTIRRLARAAHDGQLDLVALAQADDEAVLSALTAHRGVGPWTAHMFLVFHLARDDVLLPNDLGLRKAVQREYGFDALPPPRDVERVAAAWAPYRTVATWYLWRSLPGFPEPGLD